MLVYCERGLTIEEATPLSYNAVVLFNACDSLCFGIESGLCTEEALRLLPHLLEKLEDVRGERKSYNYVKRFEE